MFHGLFVSCHTLFPVLGTGTAASGPGVVFTEVVTVDGIVVLIGVVDVIPIDLNSASAFVVQSFAHCRSPVFFALIA